MSYVPASAMPHAKPHDEHGAGEPSAEPKHDAVPSSTHPNATGTVPPGPRTQPTHAGSSWLPIAAGALALGAVVGSVLFFGRSGEKSKPAKRATRRKPAKKRVSRATRRAAD